MSVLLIVQAEMYAGRVAGCPPVSHGVLTGQTVKTLRLLYYVFR